MNKIKAIVYGLGGINQVVVRYLLEKDVDIVGAIDISPHLVGRDLGEVVGLSTTVGVAVSSDAESVLSRQADIAVVSVFSQMDRMYEILESCIRRGLNVITPAEEALYPWDVSPVLATRLDCLSKAHGVTVTGGGAQDSFRVNIVSLLTGASHRIDSVLVRQLGNLGRLGAESLKNYYIGESAATFRTMTERSTPLFSLRVCLAAVLADLGLRVESSDTSVEPLVAEADTPVKLLPGGQVGKGRVLGMHKTIRIRTDKGIDFYGEQISRVAPLVGDAPTSVSECIITGSPRLHLRIEATDAEANSSAAASIVNRIPDVINSEPGYITIEKLPKLKYRAFALGSYVGDRQARQASRPAGRPGP